MNSFDARVRYTRMVIEQCFLDLLQKKPVGKITVTELCEMAQINRATFYKHYLDVPNVLEKMEEQLFNQIKVILNSPAQLETLLVDMLRYMQTDGTRYMVLGSDNGDPNLMTKTFTICYESVYPILKQNLPQIPEGKRQMLYSFLSHGGGGLLTCWIKGGLKESPEEVAAFILELCYKATSK